MPRVTADIDPALLEAIDLGDRVAAKLAPLINAAKAEAWDEGCKAGADLGLSIGERVVGVRDGWPPVPVNPYRAAHAED